MQEKCVVCFSNTERFDDVHDQDCYKIECDQCGHYAISITGYGATAMWDEVNRNELSKALRYFSDQGQPQLLVDVSNAKLIIANTN